MAEKRHLSSLFYRCKYAQRRIVFASDMKLFEKNMYEFFYSLFIFRLIFNGVASSVSSYRAYLALKFICGFFKSGYILASFVLISELIGASKRGLVGTVLSSAFAFGIVIFSIIAYYVNFWRYLTATITFIGIPLFLLACLLLPESPRWLLNMGNRKETIEVLKLIASGNQSKWDHSVFV